MFFKKKKMKKNYIANERELIWSPTIKFSAINILLTAMKQL